jgi:NAD(P)-dependent dehydrogenase (short-subunit alcohol dehydrogenase family)
MAFPAPHHDLSGKLAVVTGASSGIGKEIALGLAAQGAALVLACRDLAKAQGARAEILRAWPQASVELRQVDLASLASVRAFAKAFLSSHPRLEILVNNAGGWTSRAETSPEGIELTWATNVLGPQLLTQLLLPALKAAGKARIVNVASTAAGGLQLQDIEFKSRPYAGMTAYSQTKQANRMLTWALARQLQGSGVTANAMSPGLVRTALNRNAQGPIALVFKLLVPLMGKSPAQGADTALWLASSPDLEGVSDKFWEDRKEKACKFRADAAAIESLAALCEQRIAAV